jgi:hypothetical protein
MLGPFKYHFFLFSKGSEILGLSKKEIAWYLVHNGQIKDLILRAHY